MAVALSLLTAFFLLLLLVLSESALRMRARIEVTRRLLDTARSIGLTEEQTGAILDAAAPRMLAARLREAGMVGLLTAAAGAVIYFVGRSLYSGQLAVGLYVGGCICLAVGAGLLVLGAFGWFLGKRTG